MDKRYSDRFVPIRSALIADLAPRRHSTRIWRALSKAGLLETREYIHAASLSRRYRAPDWLAQLYADISRQPSKAKPPGRPLGSRRCDESGNRHPAVVIAGMDAIRRNVIDYDAACRWAEHCRSSANTQRDRLSAASQTQTLDAILAQGLRPNGDSGLYEYSPAYEVQATGRINERQGGLQGGRRLLKYASYRSQLRAGAVLNLDLVNCHPRLAAELCELHGIRAPMLIEYGAPGDGRSDIAADLDIPVGMLKGLVTPVLFGAFPHLSLNRVSDEIKDELLRYCPPAEIIAMWPEWARALRPFADDARRLSNYLAGPYLNEHREKVGRRGSDFIRNAAAMRFYPEADQSPGKLIAHILQGFEARFIHELAAMASDYGYEVRANEFDGLLVTKPIPQEAIDRAAAATGMTRFELREKPICSHEEATAVDAVLDGAV